MCAAPNKQPFGERGKPAKPSVRKATFPTLPATSSSDVEQGSGLLPGTPGVDSMGRAKTSTPKPVGNKPKGGGRK